MCDIINLSLMVLSVFVQTGDENDDYRGKIGWGSPFSLGSTSRLRWLCISRLIVLKNKSFHVHPVFFYFFCNSTRTKIQSKETHWMHLTMIVLLQLHLVTGKCVKAISQFLLIYLEMRGQRNAQVLYIFSCKDIALVFCFCLKWS